jgi:integrase
MKLSKRLTPAVVDALKPETEPYRVWDVTLPALFVRVQPTGVKSFNVAWSRTSSKALGKWPTTTIAAARTRARAALAERDKHGAPLAVIEARKPASERPITFGEFVEQHYAPWALANQKAGQATLDAINAQFGELKDKQLADVCAFDVERFKAARLKAGIKPATVNRDLDRIRGALSRAVDWGWLPKHPLRGVKRVRGADNSRVRYLTSAEEKRLRTALAKREAKRRAERARMQRWQRARGKPVLPDHGAFTDYLAPLVLLALNSGLRRGELFALTWEDVNLPAKLLTVQAGIAKSRKARHVPLNPEALDVLTRWKGKDERAGLVFPGPGGARLTNINKAWAALVAAAELEGFRLHDTRHHFASRLVQNGVDLYSVKELLGHADFKMTQRYAHLAPDHLAGAVAKLGARP